MLQIDVISASVICGAGSLVGAAMVSLAQPDEPRMRQALRAAGDPLQATMAA